MPSAIPVNASAGSVNIPIIDISGFLNPTDAAEREAIVEAVRSACTNEGFLQVTGHGVPDAVIDRYFMQLAKFFELPYEEKDAISFAKSGCNRGYEKSGGQKLDQLDPNAQPDQKEGFTVRVDRAPVKFNQGYNLWPAGMPEFRTATEEYYQEMLKLSKSMFRLLALALDLDENYFDEYASDPDGINKLRGHHYPPTVGNQSGTARAIGAHTDFGALTLLKQDNVGGLEVLYKPTNTWHPVAPVEGAYVVNIGDLFQRWTNDVFKSTMHRVLSTPSGKHRYSAAFFNDGKLDQVIECIPTCVLPGESPKYTPVTVEEHIRMRYAGSYAANDLNLSYGTK
ncbi:uncharacterized protein V1518DRAFT_410504 [Limtongia smithiae]|uniref:uncharacterized protein n=1 Tax=Limtongia smithiae TaxID=1125753 RepID=UPI0034CE998F